jgi:hypothetical protein
VYCSLAFSEGTSGLCGERLARWIDSGRDMEAYVLYV